MAQSATILRIISELKSASEGLTPEEREQLNSELLALALFENAFRKNNGPANLTENERALIRKLADKTNQLWRLDDEPGLDQ